MTYVTLGIFIVAFLAIALEFYDKSIIALTGALLMVAIGILTPEEAIEAIEYETILLLIAMMLLVNIASKSSIFAWLNVRIASWSKGNPLTLFLFFTFFTGLMSAFLDNVSTVVLIVPLTIEILRGMGRDPKPYIFAEIIFANLGGALTLIGDPSNIIIGTYANLSFLQFITNLWIPVLLVAIFVILVFLIKNWSYFRPISSNLLDLTVANIMIKKIQHTFLKQTLHKDFIIKVILILFLTFLGFFLQDIIGFPTYVIAFFAAILLALTTSKHSNIHEALRSVEWSTLFFFAGLFIMVGGVVKTGFLAEVSHAIATSTSNIFYLSLIILWSAGMLSMIIDNIPFVTVMVPVVAGIQAVFGTTDTTVLWWALSLGACLGGNATLIGGSANVVTAGLAKKANINITFFEYARFSFPLTVGVLSICSVYLFFFTRSL